jgi:Fe-Mn family superoxide dismutase
MYEQPKLPYDTDALEPFYDQETLEVHYGKHHAGYVKKFNAAVEGTEYADRELKELLIDLNDITGEIHNNIKNNGGGAWNHSFFWESMCPEEESLGPGEKLLTAINEAFGNLEEFKKQFTHAAATVFGSGWAWLVVNKEGKLEIIKTHNQDNPMTEGMRPLLTIDVWEHAYYLKYKNMRPDYIEAFYNIINWKKVEERLEEE